MSRLFKTRTVAASDAVTMRFHRLTLPLALLLCACARHDAAPARPASCTPQLQTRLYLGLDTPTGPVHDADWQRFVDDVVTPRFSDGLTVLEARGQWRDAHGVTTREASRVIEIVHGDAVAQQQKLAEIAGHYKARFRQQAVLLTQASVRACL
jgi:hypothetical protein